MANQKAEGMTTAHATEGLAPMPGPEGGLRRGRPPGSGTSGHLSGVGNGSAASQGRSININMQANDDGSGRIVVGDVEFSFRRLTAGGRAASGSGGKVTAKTSGTKAAKT